MCSSGLESKARPFEYFVSQLIEYPSDGQPLCHEDFLEFNEKLQKYPMTRYMKLLYFLCLEDVDIIQQGGGLFEVFNRFEAMENGPVEVDIYENRFDEELFAMFKMEGKYLQLRNRMVGIVSVGDNLAAKIQKAIEKLKEKSVLSLSTQRLVDISHSLSQKTWKGCYYYGDYQGNISEALENKIILEEELSLYKERVEKPE